MPSNGGKQQNGVTGQKVEKGKLSVNKVDEVTKRELGGKTM